MSAGTKIYYGVGTNAGGFAGQGWANVGEVDENGNIPRYSSGLYFDADFDLSVPFAMIGSQFPLKDVFLLEGSAVVQPTPYVSISEDSSYLGSKVGQKTSISLEGQLTGYDYATLLNFEGQIINNFHQQYGPFVVADNGQIVFAREYVQVQSINFSPSVHNKIVDYSIQLTANNNAKSMPNVDDRYIADMEDSFSFSENGDGTASMTHNLSARGLARGGDVPDQESLVRAKNWVKARRGWSKQVWPSYITFESTPLLVGQTQSEDRQSATFNLSEEYIYNVLKSKTTTRGGGTWEGIAYGIQNGTTVNATYSFVPAGGLVGPNAGCEGAQQAASAPDGDLMAGVVEAFNAWSNVFEKAFPEAVSRGFSLNFQNLGIESANNIPAWTEAGGTYSLEAGSAASDAGIGDFRIAKAYVGGWAGCATFPESPGGWLGLSGGAAGDIVMAGGEYDADGCPDAEGKMKFSASHLAFHELGHSLGFGHDRDDSNLTIMSYAQFSWKGMMNVDEDACLSLDGWYPNGPEYHTQILNQVRGPYGASTAADRPVITVTTSVDENYPDEFASISAVVTLQGGQKWSQDDLREYAKLDKFWHPGLQGAAEGDGGNLISSAAAGTSSPSAGSVGQNVTGPEYKSLFHLVQALAPNWISSQLNQAPVSFSIEEANSDTNAEFGSELTINVTYDTNSIFGNTIDSTAVALPFGPRHDSNAYFDYAVDLSTDNVSKITEVSIQGTIVARAPANFDYAPQGAFIDSAKMRLAAAETFLNQITDLNYYLFFRANALYEAAVGFGTGPVVDEDGQTTYTGWDVCWSLNPEPSSVSIDKNPFNGEISISASFDNKDWIKDDFLNGSIHDLSWDVSYKPSLPIFEKATSYNVNGLNLIYDLGVTKREIIDVTIKTEYHRSEDPSFARRKGVDDTIGYMYSNYFWLKYPANPSLQPSFNPKITAENINYNEATRTVDLKASFSQEAYTSSSVYYPPQYTIIKGNYVN